MGVRASLPVNDPSATTTLTLGAGASAVDLAARGSEAELQHALLSTSASFWAVRDGPEERSALHCAVLAHRIDALKLLVQHKVIDVDARDRAQCTALHLAAFADDAACVRVLAEAGAALEARDAEGMTPLLWAIDQRAVHAAQALVALGADVRAQDNRARTALDLARRLRPLSLRAQVQALLGAAQSSPAEADAEARAEASCARESSAVALAALWHGLLRMHPYLAYRSDLAAVWRQHGRDAIAAVLDGADAAQAAQTLVHALQDADTYFTPDTAPASVRSRAPVEDNPRPQPYTELLGAERVAVVVCTDHVACAAPARRAALQTAVTAALSSARALVIDARQLFAADALHEGEADALADALAEVLCAALGLDPRSVLLPTWRERAYVDGEHSFVTHTHKPLSSRLGVRAVAPVQEEVAAQGKRVVLLLNDLASAPLSALASALQLHGVDYVFETSASRTRQLRDSTAQLLLSEPGLPVLTVSLPALSGSLRVRVGETVMADHSLAFRPDLVLVRAIDDADDTRARSAAVALATRIIASQRRVPIPLVSARHDLVALDESSDSGALSTSEFALALVSLWREWLLLSPLKASATLSELDVAQILKRHLADPTQESLEHAASEVLSLLGDESSVVIPRDAVLSNDNAIQSFDDGLIVQASKLSADFALPRFSSISPSQGEHPPIIIDFHNSTPHSALHLLRWTLDNSARTSEANSFCSSAASSFWLRGAGVTETFFRQEKPFAAASLSLIAGLDSPKWLQNIIRRIMASTNAHLVILEPSPESSETTSSTLVDVSAAPIFETRLINSGSHLSAIVSCRLMTPGALASFIDRVSLANSLAHSNKTRAYLEAKSLSSKNI